MSSFVFDSTLLISFFVHEYYHDVHKELINRKNIVMEQGMYTKIGFSCIGIGTQNVRPRGPSRVFGSLQNKDRIM